MQLIILSNLANNKTKNMIKTELKRLKRQFDRIFMSHSEKRHGLVGAPKLWKMKQDFQIEFLKKHDLKKSNMLLDIGCGTLRGGIPIIEFLDAGKYTGIEVRENVLLEGRKELKERNLEPKSPNLISFDNFKDLNLPSKFDIIFAFSVLIHMEDGIVEECFNFVSQHLAENGVFYANVNIDNRTKDGNWQGFPVVGRSFEFYNELSKVNGLKLNVLDKIGNLGHKSGVEAQDNQTMLEITIA